MDTTPVWSKSWRWSRHSYCLTISHNSSKSKLRNHKLKNNCISILNLRTHNSHRRRTTPNILKLEGLLQRAREGSSILELRIPSSMQMYNNYNQAVTPPKPIFNPLKWQPICKFNIIFTVSDQNQLIITTSPIQWITLRWCILNSQITNNILLHLTITLFCLLLINPISYHYLLQVLTASAPSATEII